jgi:hypothetical protein
MQISPAKLSFEAIHEALAADAKTREPLNALAVWTELGKGLSGTLQGKGANPGQLHDVITEWCRGKTGGGAAEVDLSQWAYRLEPEARLNKQELSAAVRRVMAALETRLPELAAAAENDGDKERELFMAVVRGWFPVGLDIVRALPRGEGADEAERLRALAAWCNRFLPRDTATGIDLGVGLASE